MNVDYPLFLLQVTYFKCGGVSLGVGIYHNVADGMSSLHFINSWSDLCRGTQNSVMPFIDHTLLRSCDPPTPSFQHVEYQPTPMLSSTPQALASKSVPLSTAEGIFKLTLADLTRLRSQLSAGEGASRFSTYVILAAHVWRCVSLAYSPPNYFVQLMGAIGCNLHFQMVTLAMSSSLPHHLQRQAR